ncbi:MAG: cell wall-active antibiotics response protein [Actinomycetota bacterium]|nr:cell wall-active antibiotics response protein [Actinomycetota bacterium]
MKETTVNDSRVREVLAPLGSASSGRLMFARGAANVTLSVDPLMEELFRARFDGPLPEVHAQDGDVTIRYPRTFHPFEWRKRAAEVTLNGSIPWGIEFRGGLSGLDADLSGLGLGSFEVIGGASKVAVTLPRPSDTVTLRVSGGASNVTINRPAGVAVRVRVSGGATGLALDDQRFGAIGGETRLQTPDYEGAADRYDVEVSGGASGLTVDAP